MLQEIWKELCMHPVEWFYMFSVFVAVGMLIYTVSKLDKGDQ